MSSSDNDSSSNNDASSDNDASSNNDSSSDSDYEPEETKSKINKKKNNNANKKKINNKTNNRKSTNCEENNNKSKTTESKFLKTSNFLSSSFLSFVESITGSSDQQTIINNVTTNNLTGNNLATNNLTTNNLTTNNLTTNNLTTNNESSHQQHQTFRWFRKTVEALQLGLSLSDESKGNYLDLNGRSRQLSTLHQILQQGLQHKQTVKSPFSLYISGLPGTGKTLSLHLVIKQLQKDQQQSLVPEFDFIEINTLKLEKSEQSFTVLYKELMKIDSVHTMSYPRNNSNDNNNLSVAFRKSSSSTALTFLEQYLVRRKQLCIVLLDEVDFLLNISKPNTIQTIMYNWLHLCHLPSSCLLLICCSNTIDLSSIISPQLSSRFTNPPFVFSAYTKEEIVTILKCKISEVEKLIQEHNNSPNTFFSSDALDLLARKIAATSGDIRKALRIARRAAELCLQESSQQEILPQVTIHHIDSAFKEFTNSPLNLLLSQLTNFEKLFLFGCKLLHHSGEKLIHLKHLHTRCNALLASKGLSPSLTIFYSSSSASSSSASSASSSSKNFSSLSSLSSLSSFTSDTEQFIQPSIQHFLSICSRFASFHLIDIKALKQSWPNTLLSALKHQQQQVNNSSYMTFGTHNFPSFCLRPEIEDECEDIFKNDLFWRALKF